MAHGLIGALMESKHDYAAAVENYDQSIHLAPAFALGWTARCWARAMTGALEGALSDCNESLRLNPRFAGTYGERAFVYLKLGKIENAIADYGAALKLDPKLAGSLYGRGIAKLRGGDDSGNADLAAAKTIQSDIAEEFARYGVTLEQPRIAQP
jgi:tetratricopeptide (TPR) repeat protein